MSLRRTMSMAGYAVKNHHAGLSNMLKPDILALFAEAVEQGKPLPPKYTDVILAAIAAADVAALE
jgi:hypothetical protein